MTRSFLALALLLGAASLAQAQTGPCPTSTTDLAISPTHVCIQPSSVAAHNNTNPLDTAAIARYDILFFAPGVDTATGSPVQTVQVAKQPLNASGVMWVARAELGAIPVGQVYRGRAIAVGVTGLLSGRSAEGNPFGRPTGTVPLAPALVGFGPL